MSLWIFDPEMLLSIINYAKNKLGIYGINDFKNERFMLNRKVSLCITAIPFHVDPSKVWRYILNGSEIIFE